MSIPKVIVSGSIAIDRIMNFQGEYRELIEASQLEVLSVSVLVNSLDEAEGGTGANIAYNLALLGEKPILLGSIGSNGEAYLDRLKRCGVDTSLVNVSSLPTASFNVLTDKGGNQVGGFYPGAMADSDSLSFNKNFGEHALFVVAAHDPAAMRRQVEECINKELRLVYDPGQQVNNLPGEDLKAGTEAAEIVIVNEYEANLLAKKTGRSLEELQAQSPVFIMTHGEKGSTLKSRDGVFDVGSSKPAKITDPTGAGDAYRAGFLYGYLRQWDIKKCGQLGAVTASFALEQHGPQADVSKTAIQERYQQTFKEEIEL